MHPIHDAFHGCRRPHPAERNFPGENLQQLMRWSIYNGLIAPYLNYDHPKGEYIGFLGGLISVLGALTGFLGGDNGQQDLRRSPSRGETKIIGRGRKRVWISDNCRETEICNPWVA
jgi:hypothetical protein